MQRYSYLCLFLVFSLFVQAQQPDTSISLFFPIDSFELPDSEKEKLDEFLATIPLDRLISSSMVASCDAPGSSEYNETLGLNRLNAVQKLLPQALLKNLESSVNLGDKGEEKKEYSDEDRRVDLNIFLRKEEIDYGPGIEELLSKLKPEPQEFEIDPRKDTILYGQEGSILIIPANTFKVSRKTSQIRIELNEALDYSDMLLQNLTTTSKGKILESGGMVNISAWQGKRKLSFVRNRNIELLIPKRDSLQNPEIFKGRMHDPDSIDWTAIGRPNLVSDAYPDFNYCCSRYTAINCNFWCRLGRFFRGTPPPTPASGGGENSCDVFKDFLEKYEVESTEELMAVVSDLLAEQLETPITTAQGLFWGLEELNRMEIKARLDSGTATTYDLNYYLADVHQLGWINIDEFSKRPNWQLTRLHIPISPQTHSDVKLVFKSQRSILPPNWTNENGAFFKDIPKNYEVIVVATQILDGKYYLAMQEITLGKDEVKLEFEELSLEEIAEAWEDLNSI